MKKTLVIIALVLNTSIVTGYSEQNHTRITKFAIQYLNTVFGNNFISREESDAIIKGNRSEDRFGHKWLIRYWNQHFYNPFKPKEYWRRSKSIDVRFERITKRCFRRVNSSKYFYSIGEIVHHIQDVTNPAHVVPVFHGGGLKDKFDIQDVSAFFPENPNVDLKISYAEPYLKTILKPIAERTLESINKPFVISVEINGITTSKNVDWTYFWKDNPKSWFGSYGVLGRPENVKRQKIDNYLIEKIRKGNTTYFVNHEIYREFSSMQLELAIERTAQFIYFAKKFNSK